MSATHGERDGILLRNLRVLDFGQFLAAPMTAMFLADFGADVIHVDPPGGPRWDDPANAALHRGKRTIEIDLKSPDGLEAARRLAATADVVLEGFRPGVMTRLGLSARAALSDNPGLIWCSMPGFPADHPLAEVEAWEGIVSAATGLYVQHKFLPGDPIFTSLPLASNFAAFMAAQRIAAALISRMRTGAGEILEVSLFEACFQAIGPAADTPASRDISAALRFKPWFAPVMKTRPTADGSYLYFDAPLRGLQAFIDRFIPGYDLLDLDESSVAELASRLDELVLQRTAAEWERIGQEEVQYSLGLVQSAEEWLEDSHALDSASIVEVEDPELGTTRQPGYGALLSRTPGRVRFGRQASDKTPEAIDWVAAPWDAPSLPQATIGLALEGIRVLDCSTLLAGPTTTRILAQHGAEVIKIDRTGIGTGDIDPLTDDTLAFVGLRTVSAGKRMTYVDLKDPRGRDILAAIIASVDIVHHNFTPAAADRVGLGADEVRRINGSAIVSSVSLHSRGGFRGAYRGHDMVAQMVTGIGVRMGGADLPEDTPVLVNDNATGQLQAFGLMLALIDRAKTGTGQDVNSSLSRTATLHQVPFLTGYAGRVWDEPAGLDAPGWHAGNRLYRAGDDWFYLAARSSIWPSALSGCSLTSGIRLSDDVGAQLEEVFREHTADECIAALREAGISAHRRVTLTELAEDEYVRRKRFLAVADHPGIGRAIGIGLPLYGTGPDDGRALLAARAPGTDTAEVLREYGFGDEIDELKARGVIAEDDLQLANTTLSPGFWRSAAAEGKRIGGVVVDESLAAEIADYELDPTFLANWGPA
ncbi:MAG TPA: CoA transferase [Solirubrobacterales bacterium]|nr:CoA transferase [Solirubrobacterales bacterium]